MHRGLTRRPAGPDMPRVARLDTPPHLREAGLTSRRGPQACMTTRGQVPPGVLRLHHETVLLEALQGMPDSMAK